MYSLEEIVEFFETFIPLEVKAVYTGSWGLERVSKFAKFLGNPQENYQVVHIAGTSGKGSVSYLTSGNLASQNLKVGLHVSPFLLDFREAFQINNNLIDLAELNLYFKEFKSKTLRFIKKNQQTLTYYELLTVFAYFIFAKEKVNVAVVEVGLGGLYDCTNIVQNQSKICVITKLGFDHMEILGETISEITLQKCGIVKQGNVLITIQQEFEESNKIIYKTALKNNSRLISINKYPDFLEKQQLNRFYFEGQFIQRAFKLELRGDFQMENATLALAAFEEVYKKLRIKNQKLSINQESLSQVLLKTQIPGRMDLANVSGNLIILDGAHNPQKMENLVINLKKIFPKKKFRFLISFLKGKDYTKMLEIISRNSDEIVYSKFQVKTQALNKESVDYKNIEKNLKELGFKNYVYYEENKLALDYILKEKWYQNNEILIFTGSLYFLSEIYKLLKPLTTN